MHPVLGIGAARRLGVPLGARGPKLSTTEFILVMGLLGTAALVSYSIIRSEQKRR